MTNYADHLVLFNKKRTEWWLELRLLVLNKLNVILDFLIWKCGLSSVWSTWLIVQLRSNKSSTFRWRTLRGVSCTTSGHTSVCTRVFSCATTTENIVVYNGLILIGVHSTYQFIRILFTLRHYKFKVEPRGILLKSPS